MMKNKVSVIIPLYNKEKYIKNCINSILNQTYKNFEIIVVDDGSTDGSNLIMKELIRSNDNILYFYRDHLGVSEARNFGIDKCTGDYIIFVDADDELQKDYLERLLRYKEYDLVVSGLVVSDLSKNRSQSSIKLTDKVINLNIKSDLKNIFNRVSFKIFAVVYTKLYKTKIIQSFNIRFKEINLGEDTLFVLNYLSHVNTIKVISYAGYTNNIIPNTLSRKYVNNIWKMLSLAVNYANDIFELKYNEYWNFLYLRAIKIFLKNDSISYKKFKDACIVIRNDINFKHVKTYKKNSINNIVFLLLKEHCDAMLYILVKIR